jgi:hypothetical protein
VLINPDCGCRAELEDPPSFGGSGLFLRSLRVVVEDEGVATGD